MLRIPAHVLAVSVLAAAMSLPVMAADVREPEQEAVQEPDAEDLPPDLATPPNAVGTAPAAMPAVVPPVTSPMAPVGTPAAPVAGTPVPPAGSTTPAMPEKSPTERGDTHFDTVLLHGLNKVTAHTQPIEAPIGKVVHFGTIDILVRSCWKAAPEDRPENAALLDISEQKQGEAPQRLFSGWMFSSTPALSSLEHPFYDIHVIECMNKAAKK